MLKPQQQIHLLLMLPQVHVSVIVDLSFLFSTEITGTKLKIFIVILNKRFHQSFKKILIVDGGNPGNTSIHFFQIKSSGHSVPKLVWAISNVW